MERIRLAVGSVVGALLLYVAQAQAATIDMVKNDQTSSKNYGTVISALSVDSTRYTGWINVANVRNVAFDVASADADDSVTAVTMTCQTSQSSATANGSGFDIVSIAVSGSTATAVTLTWSYATGTADQWTWTVSNVPGQWLNCAYAATGTPGGTDTVTVVARAITP